MNHHDAYNAFNYDKPKKADNPHKTHSGLDLIPLDEVLAKGTIFRKLYEPYKIIPKRPKPESEESAAMQELQTYSTAALDLNLYLDVHPQDKEAIEFYNEIVERFKKSKTAYEDRFGPICLTSKSLKSFPWTWTMSNWPWLGDEK